MAQETGRQEHQCVSFILASEWSRSDLQCLMAHLLAHGNSGWPKVETKRLACWWGCHHWSIRVECCICLDCVGREWFFLVQTSLYSTPSKLHSEVFDCFFIYLDQVGMSRSFSVTLFSRTLSNAFSHCVQLKTGGWLWSYCVRSELTVDLVEYLH